MDINHTSMVGRGSKVKTLSLCWDHGLPKGPENAYAFMLLRSNVVQRETTLPQGLA